MFTRSQLNLLLDRSSAKRKFIQIITGTRQIGKTTLVEQLLQKVKIPGHYASADMTASSPVWINQQWEIARIKQPHSGGGPFLLVFDEIQKIQDWSEAVKKEWDRDTREKRDIRLILLGSSTLLLEKGLRESLAGRFELIKLPHWSFAEMREAFGFSEEEYVWYGGYPGAAELISDEKRWKDYIRHSIIEATIFRDILQLTNVQKPAVLRQLFELGCSYSGQILSYTKMLGRIMDKGNTTTLAHYQNLLDQVWFLSGIQKYSRSEVTARGSIPKWNVYNTSFLSVSSEYSFSDAVKSPETWGRHVESAVGAYLLNEARIHNWKVFYWRDGNYEVDYIIKSGSKIIALEVKSGRIRFHAGMEEFNRRFRPYRSLLISSDSLSWKEFLELNLEELFRK